MVFTSLATVLQDAIKIVHAIAKHGLDQCITSQSRKVLGSSLVGLFYSLVKSVSHLLVCCERDGGSPPCIFRVDAGSSPSLLLGSRLPCGLLGNFGSHDILLES